MGGCVEVVPSGSVDGMNRWIIAMAALAVCLLGCGEETEGRFPESRAELAEYFPRRVAMGPAGLAGSALVRNLESAEEAQRAHLQPPGGYWRDLLGLGSLHASHSQHGQSGECHRHFR